MSLTESDFASAQRKYPSLQAIRGPDARIDKVKVRMVGIIGGGSRASMVYDTIITFDGYPGSEPAAWIAQPADSQIRHMNIFHQGGHLNLPHVCMGNYGSIWAGMPTAQRTLLHFLLALTHVLENENPHSPARH